MMSCSIAGGVSRRDEAFVAQRATPDQPQRRLTAPGAALPRLTPRARILLALHRNLKHHTDFAASSCEAFAVFRGS
jgi:hypothetical protein